MVASMGTFQLFFNDFKPDIDNAPWRDNERPIKSKFYQYFTYSTQMCEPNFFFLSQILTLGESDLRDFSITYMDNFEAFIYSWLCVFDMLWNYPFAVAWVIFVGPIYTI